MPQTGVMVQTMRDSQWFFFGDVHDDPYRELERGSRQVDFYRPSYVRGPQPSLDGAAVGTFPVGVHP
jgi:hypothetical protein